MKITGFKSTLFRYPSGWVTSESDPSTDNTILEACVVELLADNGLSGIGIGDINVYDHIGELVNGLIIGEDPRGVAGLWQRMKEYRLQRGNYLPTEAIAVLDIALWDLKAKANGEPLWKCLGGSRPSANVYASYSAGPLQDDEVFKAYSTKVKTQGICAGKLGMVSDQDANLQGLSLMEKFLEHMAGEPVLMIDAHESWSPKQAILYIREMERDFDLTWVEAPVRHWDILGLKRVSDSIKAGVCTPVSFDSGDYLSCFHHHAADIIQLSIKSIGITEVLQLADASFGYELPVTLSESPGNIQAHLSGAMPYFMNMELADCLPLESILTTDIRIENGRAIAGDQPGHGLVIDCEALALAEIQFQTPANSSS